ncbi:MAG: CoA-binding protein [Bacteroidota bacterium]
MGKKTVVLGASENRARYSNLATNNLVAKGHEVIAVGRKTGQINGVNIETAKIPVKDVDTITLYLNPTNQKEYYDYILSLQPKRVIFNPGTENDELEELLKQKGIKAQEACTLVLLSTGQY